MSDWRKRKRRPRPAFAARFISERLPNDANFRPLPLNHRVQRRSCARRYPDAAMRRWSAEMADRVRAMDRILAVEEDRVRHRRVAVLGGMDHHVKRSRMEYAARGCITGPARGYRPDE